MQVLLNTDHHVDGRHAMAEHLETVVKAAMHRFGEHVTRIEAHLADVNSQVKGSDDDIQCTLEARLAGMEPVVVKDHAGNAHQSITGAVGKLQRAVATALAKQDRKRGGTMTPPVDSDSTL